MYLSGEDEGGECSGCFPDSPYYAISTSSDGQQYGMCLTSSCCLLSSCNVLGY